MSWKDDGHQARHDISDQRKDHVMDRHPESAQSWLESIPDSRKEPNNLNFAGSQADSKIEILPDTSWQPYLRHFLIGLSRAPVLVSQ